MNKVNNRFQRGDTIVEVLLAVAVISSMLVGAFAIANKSSSQIRMAQERTEATKLTTTVLELMKNKGNELTATQINKWLCYRFDNNTWEYSKIGGLDFVVFPPYESTDDINTNYNSSCLYSNNGGVQYITFFKYDSVNNMLTVNTRWDRAGGGRDQQVMVYRGE